MGYEKQIWQDGVTPLDAQHMNHMEEGIEAALPTKETAYEMEISGELTPETITWSGEGWTETADGFAHTVGQTAPLEIDLPFATGTDLYQVAFHIASPTDTSSPDASVAVYPSIGDSDPFALYDGSTGNMTWVRYIRSVSDGKLIFQPCDPMLPTDANGQFDGVISNISVKRITSIRETYLVVYDANGAANIEMRQTPAERYNVYIGKDSGKSDVNAKGNVSVGALALSEATSGFWNVALGDRALEKTTVGSRNIAIGHIALQECTSGDRNVAIGSFALCRNHGFRNIAIGADAAWYNTTGYNNIAIGVTALGSNTTGADNIAIGSRAHNGMNGSYGNVVIGASAGGKNGDNNVVIGKEAFTGNGGGSRHIAIGYRAGKLPQTMSDTIAIGAYATPTKTGQTVIGGNRTVETVVVGDFIVRGTDGVSRKVIFNQDGTCRWEAV